MRKRYPWCGAPGIIGKRPNSWGRIIQSLDSASLVIHELWAWAWVASRVDVPNSVTNLNWTHAFEWYVIWCASKNV